MTGRLRIERGVGKARDSACIRVTASPASLRPPDAIADGADASGVIGGCHRSEASDARETSLGAGLGARKQAVGADRTHRVGSMAAELPPDTYLVDRLLASRQRAGRREFLVRWQGYGPQDDTWEGEENILNPHLIAMFFEREKLVEARNAELRESGKRRRTLKADLPERQSANDRVVELAEYLVSCGGTPSLVDGWTAELQPRGDGLGGVGFDTRTSGTKGDVYYRSPQARASRKILALGLPLTPTPTPTPTAQGEVFRSRREVARFLSLDPSLGNSSYGRGGVGSAEWRRGELPQFV